MKNFDFPNSKEKNQAGSVCLLSITFIKMVESEDITIMHIGRMCNFSVLTHIIWYYYASIVEGFGK